MSAKMSRVENGHIRFKCPGCGEEHAVTVNSEGRTWAYNGKPESPTIAPMVSFRNVVTLDDGEVEFICESVITDGKIAFCLSSSHALAGQTVELPADY